MVFMCVASVAGEQIQVWVSFKRTKSNFQVPRFCKP